MGLRNLLPAVCSALGSNNFEREFGVRRISVEGPTNGANAITFEILGSDAKTSTSDFGYFQGDVVTVWVVEPGPDCTMVTQKDFSYVDRHGKKWFVPANNAVDGASIPRFLWTAVGGPYEGDYRRASVIHDYYCVVRSEPSKAVHRMFYEAMLCDGVDPGKAAYMYAAVRIFGPRWDENGRALTVSPQEVERLERMMDQLLGE